MRTYTKTTQSVKGATVKMQWHLVDANDKILGRMAVQVAHLLMGKHKPEYVDYLNMGDSVVIINASGVKVTGRKETDKIYTRYSGFPGGLKEITYDRMKAHRPSEILRRAVIGMLPKNKLRKHRIKNLYVFQGQDHPFQHKFTS